MGTVNMFQRCSKMTMVLLLSIVMPGKSANILMYLPIAARSYVSSWEPLVTGLSSAGHRVTFITRFEVGPLQNLTQIVIKSENLEEIEHIMTTQLPKAEKLRDITEIANFLPGASTGITKTHEMALERMKYLLDQPWDLVISCPLFNELGTMLAHHLNVPVIQFLPVNAEMFLSAALGHPDNVGWSTPDADSIFGRMKSLLLKVLYGQYIKPTFFVHPQIELARRHLKDFKLKGQDYWRLERNTDFSLYMSSTALDNLNPRLPNTLQVGFIHCKEGGLLPHRINTFIEGSQEPVIYMSLGSLHKSENLSDKNKAILQKVFSSKRVIWKISEDFKSNNILTGIWFPQQDIMAHNKTGLFVSQCGLNSMQEAIYHKLPILCLPLTYEQNQNSDVIVRKGLGMKLDLSKLTASMLEEHIDEVMNNPAYKNNAKLLSDRVKDRPVPILQESLFWVDYVIRHRGTDHLKSRRRYSSLYEFYHLDILMYLLAGVSVISVCTVLVWANLMKLTVFFLKLVHRQVINLASRASISSSNNQT